MIAVSNESHLLVEEYFYTVHDSFWSGHTVKYVKTAIHSLKTLNMFTYGPGHCLNTAPAIQLEILKLWESSGRHERNLTEVQRVSKIFFKNIRIFEWCLPTIPSRCLKTSQEMNKWFKL